MNGSISQASKEQLAGIAMQSMRKRDWASLHACAAELLRRDKADIDGLFMLGLVEKAANHPVKSAEAFARVLELDDSRYDAAVELAAMYAVSKRNSQVVELLDRYREMLADSPRYLDMAATTYTNIGLPHKGYPLYKQAVDLQQDADLFRANLAACAVYMGDIDEAGRLYRQLLEKNPHHQRNHYYLSRLAKAKDDGHIAQMQQTLAETGLPAPRNIFIYYALGKELEDLERWDDAFEYYQKAGDAVTSVANYDVRADIDLIDKVIDVFDADWYESPEQGRGSADASRTPIFVLGLPRTGTTLTERTISSHSQVYSIGETQYLELAVRMGSKVQTVEPITLEMIDYYRTGDVQAIASLYSDYVSYLVGAEAYYVEKLPHNYLYIGLIAKAFPNARIVSLKRHPMDACFSMFKQVFTHVFKFSYSLENLGRYYVAYHRLMEHWRAVLGDRLIEIAYEDLVADHETQTRILLDRLGLEFEQACLDFQQNKAASATASSVQVREGVHSRSVNKWKNFESQLAPLSTYLESNGIDLD